MTPVATVIGDLVGSRSAQDRADLHQRLSRALAEVNDELTPLRGLWVTAGDEYQGTFATVAEAVRATLLVRVRLWPAHDVRHGIGWGTTSVLDEAGTGEVPGVRQDEGPPGDVQGVEGESAVTKGVRRCHADHSSRPHRGVAGRNPTSTAAGLRAGGPKFAPRTAARRRWCRSGRICSRSLSAS